MSSFHVSGKQSIHKELLIYISLSQNIVLFMCLVPLNRYTILGDVRQLLAESRQFPPGILVSPNSTTDRHDMTMDVKSGVKHQTIKSNPFNMHRKCLDA